MSLHRVCCCPQCCTTTSFSITTLPSVSYTLACGTNAEYTNGGGTAKNLNAITPNALLQSANPLFPGTCATPCIYATTSNVGSGVFFSRCPGAVWGNTWTYAAGARCEIIQNNSGSYTAVVNLFHVWSNTGSGPAAMPTFTIGVRMGLNIASDLCPDGTYSNGGTFTACNSSSITVGTYTTIPTGGPTVTFGTPSGTLVLA